MKNINGYVNLKTDLSLVELTLKSIEIKEANLKKMKDIYLKLYEELNLTLNKMNEKLKELKGIDKELFYEIAVNGMNVTRAVDKVAFTYDVDPSTIWKSYYPKIKTYLNELSSSKIPVEIGIKRSGGDKIGKT